MTVARKLAACLAVSAFVAVTMPSPAAAQVSDFVIVRQSCIATADGTGAKLDFEWTSGETGTVMFTIVWLDGDRERQIYRTTNQNAAAFRVQQNRSVLGDGDSGTWSWAHANGTETGIWVCVPPPPATLDDIEDTLTAINAELETIDSRLTNVNTNVQMTTTNVADVENLLGTTNTELLVMRGHLAVIRFALTDGERGLPAQLTSLDDRLDSLDNKATLNLIRLDDVPALVNQARNQTHALLALVAIMFALWLRPIFRSRKAAS